MGAAEATLAGQTSAAWQLALGRCAVLLARDRPDEALAAAVAARTATAAAPLAHARGQLAEGKGLAATGERRRAIATLRSAEAAFDGFGALRNRNDAAPELRRLGHRIPRPAPGAPSDPRTSLTRREHEISELVATGRTNREIA